MEKPLNLVLLIDDKEDDNLLNERILVKYSLAKKVIRLTSGKRGLDYLNKVAENAQETKPDLILLDINMPEMNGWEFLECLESLKLADYPVVCMLSASDAERDKRKANEYALVKGFLTKPLTREGLDMIRNL